MKPICISAKDKTTELIRENFTKKKFKPLRDSVMDEQSMTILFRIGINHIFKHPPTKRELSEYQNNVMTLDTFDKFLLDSKGARRK